MFVRMLIIVYWLVPLVVAVAQKPVVITEDAKSFEIRNNHAAIFEDPTNTLTISKIATLPDSAFSPDLPFY
ncbi:MAG TPA: hypothetical protein VIK89_01965, partial [Cytophagaceae bacterium]